MVSKVPFDGHPAITIEFDDGPNNPQIRVYNWSGISLGAVERAGMLAIREVHKHTVAASRVETQQHMEEKDQRVEAERTEDEERRAASEARAANVAS